MPGAVTSLYLRADERAAVDALSAEVGCRRGDLVRVALRWLYGRHPDEVRRRLSDLPRDGRGLNRAGRDAARWAEDQEEASRPDDNGTAREVADKERRGQSTGPT